MGGGKEDYIHSCQRSAVTGLVLGPLLSPDCTYDLYVAILLLLGGFHRKLELEYRDPLSEGTVALACPLPSLKLEGP